MNQTVLAAIDLGSNSFRLHVGRHTGGRIEIIRSAREATRLAAGLDEKNELSEDAMHRGIDALYRLGDIIQVYRPHHVRAVATNTLRVAKNTKAFLLSAERALGQPIEIISGEEEARLIYLGIAHQLLRASESRLVLDIGGGSTEVIVGEGEQVISAASVEIGTVRQTRQFFRGGQLDDAGFDAAIHHAARRFQETMPAASRGAWHNVYGSSGTMRAISEIISRNKLGDEGITEDSLHQLKKRLIRFGHINKIKLDKVRPERAESIVGGLSILMGIMRELGIGKLHPVEGGLRLGVMWDLHFRNRA